MQQHDPNNPHGHTASTARHEGRLRVQVIMRADQDSQMMPDGRGYSGPGPHEFQIYKSDLRHLQALVEPCNEAQLADIAQIVEERTDEWCRETKLGRESCPINFPAEYRLRYRRDLLPVVAVKIISEMDTVAVQHKRDEAIAITESTGAAMISQNAALATAVATAVAREMAALGVVAQPNKQR